MITGADVIVVLYTLATGNPRGVAIGTLFTFALVVWSRYYGKRK